MSEKRKVCLITNWYPTPENPFQGSFFREQAIALRESFDFLVVHYSTKGKVPDPIYWIRNRKGKNLAVQQINQEYNITEYMIQDQLPLSLSLLNRLYDPVMRLLKRNASGAERFEMKAYKKHKREQLQRIFRDFFPEDFDVLYCVSAQTESGMLRDVAEIMNKPYVVAEHGPFPWPNLIVEKKNKEAIEAADRFLAISYDKVRQVLMQDVKPKQISFVGNMVDEDQFVLGSGSGGAKTFVMVAAHSFYKNYPLFIEVFNRLTQITNVPFRVIVVGYNANKGYSKDADLLEQTLQSSLFADRLELIPAVGRDQIHTVYGRADAFVMTSVQEGMPVSAMEAGCCGLPIFSTMCGGVEDYVDDKMGRIFKIIDSESFALGLKDYLEGKITFDRNYIRQQVVSRYGKKAFTDNMTAIFNEVIDRYQENKQ